MSGINKRSYKLSVVGLTFYDHPTLKGSLRKRKKKMKVFKATKERTFTSVF